MRSVTITSYLDFRTVSSCTVICKMFIVDKLYQNINTLMRPSVLSQFTDVNTSSCRVATLLIMGPNNERKSLDFVLDLIMGIVFKLLELITDHNLTFFFFNDFCVG